MEEIIDKPLPRLSMVVDTLLIEEIYLMKDYTIIIQGPLDKWSTDESKITRHMGTYYRLGIFI